MPLRKIHATQTQPGLFMNSRSRTAAPQVPSPGAPGSRLLTGIPFETKYLGFIEIPRLFGGKFKTVLI